LVVAKSIFWICLMLVAYTYFLYPVLLFFVYSLSQVRRDWYYLLERGNRRVPSLASDHLPSVTLVIPAYNEQAHLPNKIANLHQIDYPREKLEVVFISDGSTDRTNEILRTLQGPGLKTIFLPERKGKSNALNLAVVHASHDIWVCSDASTLFSPDAVKNLARHFSDPNVGIVCGALEFERTTESRQTEGLYWKYETMLRLMEARMDATLTASGAIYALRRQCYRPLAPDTVLEDLVISMSARNLGYRVLYDPEATATDFAASSVAGEFTRRVRLAVGSFRALRQLL
jgi:cellulose synthase/poly-beta-1,6-N-acetylglucosamine synthase-like glycosyltransferase